MTLYISDLDGTLLTSSGTLSEHSRTSLNALISDGCLFTVASARSVKSMQGILTGLDLSLPVIEFNGACISDLESGRHGHINSFPWDLAYKIIDHGKTLSLAPFFSTINGASDFLFPAEPTNDGMKWYLDDRIENADPRLQSHPWSPGVETDHELIGLTFIDSDKTLSNFETALSADETIFPNIAINRFENLYSPGWHWLTVHDARAKKHVAVEQVRELYTKNVDELVVFGDNLNDLSMFASADRAYAVSNAAGPVLEAATAVIDSNDEDSVVKMILNEHFGDDGGLHD